LHYRLHVCHVKNKDNENFSSKYIEGLTLDNYPKVDGSTSTEPLNVVNACELLGIDYEPHQNDTDVTWGIKPNLSKKSFQKFEEKIKSSPTDQSFINLIDHRADVILSVRKMSPDEKKYADNAGISLIETPIALDAFVFIVNTLNPVKSLTIEQIQGIYTGEITNWKEFEPNLEGVEEKYGPITAYVRNANSGSQEIMKELIMRDLDMIKGSTHSGDLLLTMGEPFFVLASNINGICYTVYYYKENIQLEQRNVQSIAVNGIIPNSTNISNKTYPFVTEVYAVIRSDLDQSSMAYKVYEFLQTAEGKQIIRKSGYLSE